MWGKLKKWNVLSWVSTNIFVFIIIILASNNSQTDDLFVGEINVSSGRTVNNKIYL